MPAGNAGVAVTPQRPVGPPPKFSSEVGTNGVPRAPRRNGRLFLTQRGFWRWAEGSSAGLCKAGEWEGAGCVLPEGLGGGRPRGARGLHCSKLCTEAGSGHHTRLPIAGRSTVTSGLGAPTGPLPRVCLPELTLRCRWWCARLRVGSPSSCPVGYSCTGISHQ